MIKLLGLLGLTLVPSLIGNVQNVDSSSQDVEINQRSLDVSNSLTQLEIGKKYVLKDVSSNSDFYLPVISSTQNSSFNFVWNNIQFQKMDLFYASGTQAGDSHVAYVRFFYASASGSMTYYSYTQFQNYYFSNDLIFTFQSLPSNTYVMDFLLNNLVEYNHIVPSGDNLYDVGYDFIHDYLFNSKLDDYSFTFMGESMTMRTWLSHVLTITTIGLVFAFLISIIIWIFKWFGGLFKW